MRPPREAPEPPNPRLASLFDLPLGGRLKEMGQAAALNGDHVWMWRIRALGVVSELAAAGSPFTADDVVARVGLPREGANRNNAVGALFTAAKKRKWIVQTGSFRPSRRSAAHSRMIAVWVGNPDTWAVPPDPWLRTDPHPNPLDPYPGDPDAEP